MKTFSNDAEIIKQQNLENLLKKYQEKGEQGVQESLINAIAENNPSKDINVLSRIDNASIPRSNVGNMPKTSTLGAYSNEAKNTTVEYNRTHTLSSKIPDGYRDAGRQTMFDEKGLPIGAPSREVLLVDRQNDPVLRNTIDSFKKVLQNNPTLSETEKAKTLFAFVNKLFQGKTGSERVTLTNNFSKTPMQIGDVIDAGVGVCRHKSLTAKILADEAGLNMTMRRGEVGAIGKTDPHIWNEVTLEGKKYLFDVEQNKFIDLSSGHKDLAEYYSLSLRNLY